MHGEVTDRRGRERQRVHDVRIGAERQSVAGGQGEDGGVGLSQERVVGERGDEHGFEQGRRGLPAGAVGERHDVVEQARLAAPEGFDALEHLRLTVERPRPWTVPLTT